MNILITGASGFIGKKLSQHLREKHKIFKLGSRTAVKSNNENQITVNLTESDSVKSYFDNFKKKNKVDVLIHLATIMATADNVNNINLLYSNLKIVENVVMIAQLLKPKKIINFSSIAVYPNKDGVYSEASEVKPSINTECLYGLAKFCNENILDFMLRNEEIIISHLRIAQVYGKGSRKDRIIPLMLKELKEKNTITVFGEGRRMSNFIRVEMLVKIVEVFLENDLDGIYNVGGESLSYLQLAQRLVRQHGNHNTKIIKVPEGSRAKFYLDTTKVEKLLNQENIIRLR